ncbi:peptidase M26 [Prevotella nigrescens]|uniref:peptidase M26 n=1 Tax=Prevotella nigrescens TaxID=28133 RepID=UPI001C601D3C|nr:peptidase M26 [Prevotella nigrescens]MBW4727010.1 peptidase M26 [Prevotella nigrescens]
MKTTNIIQRLCLFLFVLVLAAPAWATDYGRLDYETFRSRNTVNAVGKKKPVSTLRQGRVEINFSDCRTTSGTGNSAIYELAKGSHFTVKVDDGYAIRWIILRDTEGGESYSNPKGKYRVSSVTSGYDYYFEKEAISNSGISGANHDNLNDDNNNIVVYNYDAPKKAVEIWTHNRSNWDQFKVRDIIVGYVRAPKVRFERDRYDIYYTSIPSSSFQPVLNYDTHNVHAEFKVDNNDIATVKANGFLKFKRPGTVVLTATCHASENCAKAQCSTTVTTKRDGVTFTSEGLPDVIFNNTSYSIRDYLYNSKTKSGENFDYNDESFSVTSSNNAVLRYDMPYLKFGGTAGEVIITFTQKETNFYEAASLSHTFIVARRDQYGTILIKDANEWKVFCKLVNEKGMTNLNARLEADVNLGGDIAMVGTTSHLYAGTFDGQNHTLKFSWNGGSDSDIAPFKKVSNATIKNLRTEGTIKSNSYYLSGLVGDAYGTVNISNCASNVNITSSHTGGICDAAGMISYIDSSAKVAITDCLVEGNITAMTDEGKKRMSGFVFYQYGTCTLTNCLYIGENNADNTNGDSNTFANNATVTNCYYLKACGNKQGEQVTADQLKNGYVAYKLQAGRNNMVWGQTIGTNNEPRLIAFDNSAKKVYQVKFTYNNEVKATRYANSGKTVSMPTFTPKDLLGSDYNEHHYYSGIAFEGGFNGSTTVNTDRTVALTFNKKDYYEIASKENWKEFCDIVKSGQNAVDAKMTRNIDLGSEINMVGDDNNKYSGTFDGQNHTLKLDWSNTNGLLAPFWCVKDATIKNLRTEGNIKSSYNLLSGLILTVYGKTTITNCVSAVNITSTYNGSGCVIAGMILEIPYGAVVTFTDCIVKGKYNTTLKEGSISVSGFISNHNGTSTFNNCIYLGDNVPGGGYTFAAYTYLGPTLNNCYYLNACGIAQGTKITAEQLKNGEVTKKLQNNRTDKCYWAQQLGEMPDFYNAADKSKANYVYYDAAKKGWTCDDFRLTDGTAMPIGLDFTAATVTYERNFNGAQKATLCLPYDLSAQGFKVYTLSGGNKNEVHFKEVDDKLTAYTPYYITANGMPQLGGRNIEVKAYKADKMTTPAADYKFTGTVAGVSNATAAAANAYILQDDGKFHKVTTANSAATIPAYRAYIICPPQASGAKQLSVVLDGETTGIGGVTNEATDGKNGPVYDLQGHRVADRLDDARHRLPAGIYIVGGRKVVVK